MTETGKEIGRRALLQLVPAALAVHSLQAAPYHFQFFDPGEAALLDTLMEKIIPADGHSPGAHEAKVVEFADLMVAAAPDYVKEDWRSALQLMKSELQRSSIDSWLEAASQHEDDPETVLDQFFKTLKQMTVNGYYSSEVGIHADLHYQGNTYVAIFPGCDHPEHQG